MRTSDCPQCGHTSDGTGNPAECPDCGYSLLLTVADTPLPGAIKAACPGSDDITVLLADRGAQTVPPDLGWDLSTLLSPLQAPDEIGRLGPYRVLKILGIGGMGIVFQGEDATLGRKVALKAMLPGVAATDANRQRFLREARATAALRHPHIVTVYNVSEANGVPFLVIEFLEGESLDQRLRRERRLSPAEVMRIGRETADGLAAAHAVGLVHRDVKPGNIWLEGTSSRVKILDFGLARPLGDDIHLTRTGTILGTPAYMAPEQARGLPVDARTDLFSLGSVLYHLATGVLPFRGADMLAVLTSLATDEPRPVYERNPALPPPLASLIMWLLAKAPEERPPSARAVCEAIATIERQEACGDILGIADGPLLLADETTLDQGTPLRLVAEGSGPLPPLTDGEPVKPPTLARDQLSNLVGHTLGRYALRSVLGLGPHGLVFRARHHDTDEVVALKVLFPEFPHTDAEVENFSKTMKSALTLQHSHIVHVQAAGKTGPYCWIATEYVEGESLASVLERLPLGHGLDWKRAFRVAVHVSRALQYTFQHRIVHGNITPRHLLVRKRDDTVKLNHLLLRKALRKSALARHSLEQKIAADGFYLAPEQVDSQSTIVEYLCDMYSLGVILYQMVTGRLPFQGESMEETFEEILLKVPDRPRRYQKTLPREFETTILQMLPKRQEDRYPGPTELLHDLNRIAVHYRIVD